MQPRSVRTLDLGALLLLALLPMALLGDCLFGGRTFLPFDLAECPPVGPTLPADELAAMRTGCNYDATEPNIWFVPELALARAAVANGEYPHWNPCARNGAPLAAHGHLGLLDPLHWPALLFADPAKGLLYLTYVMFALAGALMYGLLRELELRPSAALFGAVAFEFSGTLLANGHWYMRMEPLALLPGMLWMLLRLERARGAVRGLPAAGLAAAVACCLLAGFPPFAIPVLLFAGLAGLLLALHRVRTEGRRGALRLLGWIAGAFAVGALLASAQLLQMALFYPESNRPPDPTLASASRFAFDPMGLLGYLFPDIFSHPGDRLLPGVRSPLVWLLYSRTEWGAGADAAQRLLLPDHYNFTEYALFPGTLPLLLAVYGLCARGPRWRFLCLLALLLLFGLAIGAGPLRYAFAVPGIQAVPPYRFAGPACVFVAMLAGLGVDRLGAAKSPWLLRGLCAVWLIAGAYCLGSSSSLAHEGAAAETRWLLAITDRYRASAPLIDPNLKPADVKPELVRSHLFTATDDAGGKVDQLRLGRERLQDNLDRGGFALLFGALAALLLSARGRALALPAWLCAPLLLLTAGELGWYGRQLNRGRDPGHPLDTPVHQFLREQRAATADAGGFLVARANAGGGDPWHLPPGTLARLGIRDLDFYSFVDGRSSEPIRRLYGDAFMIRDYLPSALPDDARLQLPWWDAMGLRYLFATRPMQFAGVRVGPVLQGARDEFFVYQRPDALPRAWVVPMIQTVADPPSADDHDDAPKQLADGDKTLGPAELDAVVAKDWTPRDRVVMTAGEAQRLPAIPRNPAAKARKVTFAEEEQARVSLTVAAGPPGYLVLADTYMRGWTAEVDGKPAVLARGNVCQRVVAVPAGECTVEFRYRTPGLTGGLLLSALGVIATAALAWLGWRERRLRWNFEPDDLVDVDSVAPIQD
jgi:hypothetical protein